MQMFNFSNSGYNGPGTILGSNQYGTTGPNLTMPNPVSSGNGAIFNTQQTPGVVPQQGSQNPYMANYTSDPNNRNSGNQPGFPYAPQVNSNYSVGSPQDPSLTYNLFNYLQSQIGKGVSPFNLSALLGSSGASTTPGSLTAPDNALLQQIFQGMQGSGPDAGLGSMMKTGNPIDQTPAWQAMVNSMNQNIARNQANLKEQFAVGGNLVGSPYGDAMQNYMQGVSSTENAQLLGAQTQAQENAQNRMLQADQFGSQFGQYMQGLDQSSIDRLYQEFIRTSPQNNPMLQYEFGAATTYPPYMPKGQGGGGIGGILSGLGGLAGGLGGLIGSSGAASSTGLLALLGM